RRRYIRAARHRRRPRSQHGLSTAGWYPVEREHAGPEHLDADYVAGYDAKTELDLEDALGLLGREGHGRDTTLRHLGRGRRGAALVLRDLVYDFEPADADRRIEEWLAGAAPTSAEGWTRTELETHVRDEHSTFAWLHEALLEHAGFEIVERDVRGGIYATYVSRRP